MVEDLLESEIMSLQNTDQGIIGMVKMVQFNPDRYPNLSKYSYYEIRKLLSGEEICIVKH